MVKANYLHDDRLRSIVDDFSLHNFRFFSLILDDLIGGGGCEPDEAGTWPIFQRLGAKVQNDFDILKQKFTRIAILYYFARKKTILKCLNVFTKLYSFCKLWQKFATN